MRKEDYFRAVAHAVLSPESSTDVVLSLMIVLHTYQFHVPRSIRLDDAGGTTVLFPLTRWHSSEIVASVFPACDKRHDPVHWYWQYDQATPFEVASRIPVEWKNQVNVMLLMLKQSELVSDLSEDD